MNNTENYGLLIAVLTTFCWSIGIFPFTEAAKRLGSGPLNQFRLTLAALVLTPFCFLVNSSFPSLGAWQWAELIASGIVGLSLGDYFSFSCYSILGARWGSLFSTISPGFVLLLSTYFLGESINIIGVIGILLSIFGVMGISLGKKQQSSVHLEFSLVKKGIFFGLGSALCQALGVVLIKMLSITPEGSLINPVQGTWVRMFAATLTLYIFSFLRGHLKASLIPIMTNKNKGLKFAFLGTSFGPVLGVTLSLYTLQLLPAAVAQTIFSLMPVFAIVNSRIFLKEAITLHSLLGAFIAIFGVILLVWRDFILGVF